jgi:transcriptional regulator with XRE-family HTH domain
MSKKSDLAAFIAARIDSSTKTQSEIAAEAGLEHANFLSMVRNGRSRLPLGRTLALADALDVPQEDLLRRCLEAYEPQLYAILVAVFPGMSFTPEELEIIRLVRAAKMVRKSVEI